MSAFTQGFNFGFTHGMFNRMFGGFNPFCGCNFFGGFNFAPMFYTPMFGGSIFTRYSNPMPDIQFPAMNFTQNFEMPTISAPKFDLSQANFNNNYSVPQFTPGDIFIKSTNSTSLSQSKKVSPKPTKAASYLNMTDSEMRKIYGNYTKELTSTYNGTAADLNKKLSNRGVLAGKGQAFIDAQKKYGISASVLAAICIQETGGKSSNATKKNNVSNISQGKGWRTFSSVEECIDYTAKLLKNDYAGKGLTCLYQVNAKYCPVQDTRGSYESQSAWAGRIDKISSQLELA